MKIRIPQSELITKLNEAIRFISSKGNSPLLSGFYFSADTAQLTVRTSSGSVVYQSSLPCSVETPGIVVVPASLFLSILKSLEAGEVEVSLEGDTVVLVQGKSRSEIATLPSEGFPSLKTFEKPQEFVLPVTEFVQNGKKVLIAASTDETKPVLTALALETAQPNALVSTDGFRLFRMQTDLSLDQAGMFLLPARTIKDLFGILEKADQPTIQCTTDEKRQELLFQFGADEQRTSLQISEIQGEFPPYQAIIPESVAFTFTVDRELLQQKVNQAMIFAREFSSIVVFWVENNELVIASQANVRGKTEARLPLLSSEGEPVKFACNGKYVLDFLASVESEGIMIQGNESLKPVLLRVPNDPAYLYLIMPFKLSE